MAGMRIIEERASKEKIADIIIKVAMAHHYDISKQDEDNAMEAAQKIHDLICKGEKRRKKIDSDLFLLLKTGAGIFRKEYLQGMETQKEIEKQAVKTDEQ